MPNNAMLMQGSAAISLKGLHDTFVRAGNDLSTCYEQALAHDKTLSGNVPLKLSIVAQGDHGKLDEATVLGDYSLQNPFVARCVIERLSKERFPRPEGGDKADVIYPIEFRSRGNGADGSVALGVELLLPVGPDQKTPAMSFQKDRAERVTLSLPGAPSFGPNGALVTLVEINDPQCSFCARGHQVTMQLLREYAGKVRFVFAFHPLKYHAQAALASRAMLAANEQGKFLEYAQKVFALGDGITRDALESAATAVGMELNAFRLALDSEKVTKTFSRMDEEATRVGVHGLPTYFINGREVVGARPYEALKQVLDEELATAQH